MNNEITLLPTLQEDDKPIKIFYSLVYLRKSHNVTQQELAEHLGIERSYLSLIENGKRNANEEMLHKIAKFFDCDIDFLRQNAYTIEKAKQVIAEQVTLIAEKGLDISKADRSFLLQVIKTLQPQIMVEESITQRVNSDGTQAYERAVKKLQAFEENNK